MEHFLPWKRVKKAGLEGNVEDRMKSTSRTGEIWTEEDMTSINKHLITYLEAEPSHDPMKVFRFDPFMRALLCAKPDQVYERYVTYLSTMQLLSGDHENIHLRFCS